jgi:hypothetical protein
MKTEVHRLSREWGRASSLLMLAFVMGTQLEMRWGKMEGWEVGLYFALVIIAIPVAFVQLLWRRVMMVRWSEEVLEVEIVGGRPERVVWAEGAVVTEDLRHFLVYAPGGGASISLCRPSCSAELRAFLEQRLYAGD